MADRADITDHARRTIDRAPKLVVIGFVASIASLFYEVPPLSYLIGCVILGMIWLGLMIYTWKLRDPQFNLISIFVMIGGLHLIKGWFYPSAEFAVLQGIPFMMTVAFGSIFLLRRWLYKFASLEQPSA